VIAELAQLFAVARDRRGASGVGRTTRAPAARRLDHDMERTREDLEAERVSEHQRNLVEALAAARRSTHFERHAVDAPAAHALGIELHVDAHARMRGEIHDRRDDVGVHVARRDGAERDAAHRLVAPIAELGLERDGLAAGRAQDAARRRPHHLEACGAKARHRRRRHRASERDREHHRPAVRHQRGRAHGHRHRDERGAGQGDVESGASRVEAQTRRTVARRAGRFEPDPRARAV